MSNTIARSQAAVSIARPKSPRRRGAPRILIADDDPLFRECLGEFVRECGWATMLASDSMQAVMFAIRGEPDVVLLDVSMPGGSGLVALERLRGNLRTRDLPVIVITGDGDPTAEPRAHALGVRAFLRKPLEMELLRATVADALVTAAAA
jgi:CheY-like chemotaxis protein